MSDKETAQMKTVSADDLRQVETEIFEKQGFSHEHAAIVADSLLEADLRGVSSHGAIRIPVYVARLAVHMQCSLPWIRPHGMVWAASA